MRIFAITLALAAASAGCKDKKQEATEGLDQLDKLGKAMDERMARDRNRKPTGTPRPQGKLTVTYDGKPVAMATALAWKSRDGSIQLTASSVPVGCAEVTGDMRQRYDGEITFDAELASTLQRDGSIKLELRSTYFDGMSSQIVKPISNSSGTGEPRQPTQVDVDIETENASMGGGAKHKLTAKGTIDALGCDVAPRNEAAAPLPPEMPATIEIAGKQLPIRGAYLHDIRLYLYTGDETCRHVADQKRSDFVVELSWTTPEDPDVSRIMIGGVLIGGASMILKSSDKPLAHPKVTVTPTPVKAGELAIHADLEVSGFPVKLDGKVTAVECPK